MKDFINQFRKDSKHLDEKKSESPENAPNKTPEVELAKEMINAYRQKYADVDINVLRNLIELKDITSEPKHDKPEAHAREITERLGPDESHETLRQERWQSNVYCPACGSNKIKLISTTARQLKDNRKYQCDDCQNIFTDESGTPLEAGVPPLSSWMFCWYLLGCSTSIQFIATKLGLDLATVEFMVRQMQKMFKAQQPLTHFLTYDEWSLKHGKSYKNSMQRELAKKQVLLGADTADAPADTSDYRKQKELANTWQT
jgi:transposase-like protein